MDNVARTPSPLQVNVARDGVIATVTLNGELDLTTAAPLIASLLAVPDEHPDRIVLDLSGLIFVDVAGARALDEAYHLLQIECPVILRDPRPSACKVFNITGLMNNSGQLG